MNRSTLKGTKSKGTKFKRQARARAGQLSEQLVQEQHHLKELIQAKVSAATKREFSDAANTIKSLQETLTQIQSSFKYHRESLTRLNQMVMDQNGEQGISSFHLPNGLAHGLPVTISDQPSGHEHECGSHCWVKGTKVSDWHSYSPLEIPQRVGWKRVVDESVSSEKPDVCYISPCGKKMSSMEEIQSFLEDTGVTDIHISQFTFDHCCSLQTSVPNPDMNHICVEDITKGQETRPISCVNSVNDEKPEEFTYTTHRTCEGDVDLHCDPGSMVCCSCKDNCRNRSECKCWQLTTEEAQAIGTGYSVGYVHGRLKRHQYSAVYECNSHCGCGPQCSNKVVQQGITHRLQVFRSQREELKWGLRALDDIPKGSFVCTYIGHIYTEKGSDETALQHGDEYFAELDYIEVIQQQKDGYESDVISLGNPLSPTPTSPVISHSTDSSVSLLSTSSIRSSLASEMDLSNDFSLSFSLSNSPTKDSGADEVVLGTIDSRVQATQSQEESSPCLSAFSSREDLPSVDHFKVLSSSEECQSYKVLSQSSCTSTLTNPRLRKSSLNTSPPHTSTSPPASPPPHTRYSSLPPHKRRIALTSLPPDTDRAPLTSPPPHKRIITPTSPPPDTDRAPFTSPPPHKRIITPTSPPPDTDRAPFTSPPPHISSSMLSSPTSALKLLGKRIRQFYNEDFCYIMDAKTRGNIGRFINHSCSPNLFVQNVFIDTHDCRFPSVALFAKRRIKALEELTWDYNYEVGSVPGRVIECLCGAPDCRERLL